MRFSLFLLLVSSVLLAACQKQIDLNTANFVEWVGQSMDRRLQSDGVEFRVVSKNKLGAESGLNDPNPIDSSLILGFPRNLLGQQNVFGGVVVGVSATKDDRLGSLKLSDITPVHVRTSLSSDGSWLVLQGCQKDCTELSNIEDLFQIPVVKSDAEFIYLDLSAFGSKLDFFAQAGTNSLKSIKTQVVRFDFTLATLVFDVENTYQPKKEKDDTLPPAFTLTTRWYLKLSSAFNPSFTSRIQKDGVGFFTTDRNKTELITRFSGTVYSKAIAKYYIKNVPAEYRPAFIDAFENWNKKMSPILGKDLFEYEFLESSDPRYNQIVTGDIRFNVLEWDLVNVAGYGGLGPSVANQMTGEIFSANVLIQGPKIVDLYTAWWKVSQKIQMLYSQNKDREAELLKTQYLQDLLKNKTTTSYSQVSLGSMAFANRAQDPRLSDAALNEYDFVDTPAGYSYETYMYGYFREMVAHELGHNLGLRHNFRGNLGSDNSGEIGTASRSVMEYLGRGYRYLNRVGDYDVMAVSYGYLGIAPTHLDWFCTDDDQVDPKNYERSAECSSQDATSNPFQELLSRLKRATDFLLLPGSDLAPIWTVDILKGQITPAITGLANYYVSSFSSAANWTNFLAPPSVSTEQIPDYILQSISEKICDPHLDEIILQKKPDAQVVAKKNLLDLRTLFVTLTKEYKKPVSSFDQQHFPCLPTSVIRVP